MKNDHSAYKLSPSLIEYNYLLSPINNPQVADKDKVIGTSRSEKIRKAKQVMEERDSSPAFGVDILVPCRNASKTIKQTVLEIKKSIYTREVFVIDLNSQDETFTEALNAGAKAIKLDFMDYGNALKKGLELSRNRHIVKVDGGITNIKKHWIDAMTERAIASNNPFVKTYWKPAINDPHRVTNITIKVLAGELGYLKNPLSSIYLFDRNGLNINTLPGDSTFDIGLLFKIHARKSYFEQVEIDTVIYSKAQKISSLTDSFKMNEALFEYIEKEKNIK